MQQLLLDPILQSTLICTLQIGSRLFFGKRPSVRLIANILFLGALSGVLISHGSIPFASDAGPPLSIRGIVMELLKGIWWLGSASVLVSAIRLFVIIEGTPREARLLQDLLVAVIYVGAALSISAYVLAIPVGTLIATSGAFAVILGLALQSTLNDVFSGIAMKIARPYAVGDWIIVEPTIQGRVIETNWRSTHLVNGTNDLVVVPNSSLAKSRFVNLASPTPEHSVKLEIRVAASQSPSAVTRVMKTALLSSNHILPNPPPSANVTALAEDGIDFQLVFRVKSAGDADVAKSEMFDLLYRHLHASGITLSSSNPTAPLGANAPELQPPPRSSALRLIDSIGLFASLTEEEREALAATMTRKTFKEGSFLAHQGTTMDSLIILRSGVAVIESQQGENASEVRRLSPGDFIGEEGILMGAPEKGASKALTFVVAYEISKHELAGLMQERPAIADELASALAGHTALLTAHNGGNPFDQHHADTLSQRIKNIFRLEMELRA